MAAGTNNHHIRASKGFCNWLVRVKRMTENPLAHVPLLNAAADRRLERPPYSIEELGALLAASEVGPVVHGMIGPDRALLYRTATETGFRWSELYSLSRASFDFESDPRPLPLPPPMSKKGKRTLCLCGQHWLRT